MNRQRVGGSGFEGFVWGGGSEVGLEQIPRSPELAGGGFARRLLTAEREDQKCARRRLLLKPLVAHTFLACSGDSRDALWQGAGHLGRRHWVDKTRC